MTPNILPKIKLEPRTRTQNFDATLQGTVHDALWMLTQQHRAGEFNGEDAASPMFAQLEVGIHEISKFKNGVTNSVSFINSETPLEPTAEKLPFFKDLSISIQSGIYLRKMIRKSTDPNVATLLGHITGISSLMINTNSTLPELINITNFEERALIQYCKGALIDGVAVANYSIPSTVSIPQAARNLLDQYKMHFGSMYHQSSADSSNWDQRALEYKFSCAAQISTRDPKIRGDYELEAIDYGGGKLDWYDFDMKRSQLLGSVMEEVPHLVRTEMMEFIPSPLAFKGMPVERWWEFEDRNIDYGALKDTYAPNKNSNYALLSLLNFGLNYSNDWFLLPYRINKGTLMRVNFFAVKNVIDVNPVPVMVTNDSWRIFTTSFENNTSSDKFHFFPAVLPKVQESEPLEKVVFMRDEMANIVWGVEKNVPDGIGGSVDGFMLQQRTQDYLFNKLNITFPPSNTGSQFDLSNEEMKAKLEYRIMNSVPENWIPFVPKVAPGSVANRARATLLQRATMHRVIKDKIVSPDVTEQFIRPRTPLLSEGLYQSPQKTLLFNEEEILRDGVIITTTYQRVRWYNGKTYIWMGRKKTVGLGEGNSALKYDSLT